MTSSRRDVLLQGAVIGAGLIASGLPGMTALAAGQPPERRSLQGLAWNDPIVATYRDAVAQMKQKAASDPASWPALAGIHGSDPDSYHFCPHGNWYFLPWHRAYLVTYERFIRQLTGNADFALPFWDWTNNPTMPDVFTSPTTPDGKPNALYVDDQDFGQGWQRSWPASDPMPPEIVGPTVLGQILNATDYEDFGTSRPAGQNSLDPSWVLTRTGDQGVLEATPHNNVHNNIGGWMPSAMSPRDPIFFMHHCNIDRIWAVWNSLGNANSGDQLWTDMPFTNNFYNPDGSSWSPKVSDLFVPENLGYTYGLVAAAAAATASPSLVALRQNLSLLRKTPGASNAQVRTFSATASGQAGAAGKPLTVAVGVDPGLIASVVARRPVPSGAEFLNFAAAREQHASGTRVLAFLRDVSVTEPQDTIFRVFLDHPGLTPAVPITDPSYVGSFGIFVHREGGHGRHGEAVKPSFVFDLTAAVQRVFSQGAPPPQALNLQILPVPTRPNVATVGTIVSSRAEIAFVGT